MQAGITPKIENLFPLYQELKKVKVKGELEKELKEMMDEHRCVADLWHRIEDLQSRMGDEEAEIEEEAFEATLVKKVVQIVRS